MSNPRTPRVWGEEARKEEQTQRVKETRESHHLSDNARSLLGLVNIYNVNIDNVEAIDLDKTDLDKTKSIREQIEAINHLTHEKEITRITTNILNRIAKTHPSLPKEELDAIKIILTINSLSNDDLLNKYLVLKNNDGLENDKKIYLDEITKRLSLTGNKIQYFITKKDKDGNYIYPSLKDEFDTLFAESDKEVFPVKKSDTGITSAIDLQTESDKKLSESDKKIISKIIFANLTSNDDLIETLNLSENVSENRKKLVISKDETKEKKELFIKTLFSDRGAIYRYRGGDLLYTDWAENIRDMICKRAIESFAHQESMVTLSKEPESIELYQNLIQQATLYAQSEFNRISNELIIINKKGDELFAIIETLKTKSLTRKITANLEDIFSKLLENEKCYNWIEAEKKIIEAMNDVKILPLYKPNLEKIKNIISNQADLQRFHLACQQLDKTIASSDEDNQITKDLKESGREVLNIAYAKLKNGEIKPDDLSLVTKYIEGTSAVINDSITINNLKKDDKTKGNVWMKLGETQRNLTTHKTNIQEAAKLNRSWGKVLAGAMLCVAGLALTAGCIAAVVISHGTLLPALKVALPVCGAVIAKGVAMAAVGAGMGVALASSSAFFAKQGYQSDLSVAMKDVKDKAKVIRKTP